jgi:proteasome lid subunit RPN8/RPN11
MVVIHEVKSSLRRNATISQQAFVGMITNAIEVYKKETFGILLGKKHKKHYYVADTIAYQTAKRGYETVNITSNRVNRINLVLKHLTDQQVIGDFHSHPEGPEKLSPTDVADLFSGAPSLTCLVSVYKSKKCQPWKCNADYSLSGTIGTKYFVKVIAYEIRHKENSLERIKIICPYIRKLNSSELYKRPLCK